MASAVQSYPLATETRATRGRPGEARKILIKNILITDEIDIVRVRSSMPNHDTATMMIAKGALREDDVMTSFWNQQDWTWIMIHHTLKQEHALRDISQEIASLPLTWCNTPMPVMLHVLARLINMETTIGPAVARPREIHLMRAGVMRTSTIHHLTHNRGSHKVDDSVS